MRAIIGLGNPGDEYKNNRHNVGFMFLDFLTKETNDLSNKNFKYDKYLKSAICHLHHDSVFIKPQTFMNRSGEAVNRLIKNFKLKISDLTVVHDDLDIPLGKFHIQKTGPKLHNGIESIENTLGSKDFLRIRVGVDNRKADNRIDGETYVLQDFLPDEKSIILTRVFPDILSQITLVK
jgi:PTH1 family peptidyl-tRNA hydrolase